MKYVVCTRANNIKWISNCFGGRFKLLFSNLQVEQWARDAKIHDNDRQLFSIDTLEPIIQAAALLQVSVLLVNSNILWYFSKCTMVFNFTNSFNIDMYIGVNYKVHAFQIGHSIFLTLLSLFHHRVLNIMDTGIYSV